MDKIEIVKRIESMQFGTMPKGQLNKITDVAGVRVGHATLKNDNIQTGVTLVLPAEDNYFERKCVASSYVINGFGKSTGLIQIEELGQLESPIALTNTLNVGKVSDAVVDYMIQKCQSEGLEIKSFNPVICECNDSFLNDIILRKVDSKMVYEAIYNANQNFEEGAVGGGRGMSCHQLKGGIGSASRLMHIDNQTFTLGVLVQANHGRLEDLTIDSLKIGEAITNAYASPIAPEPDKGSIIVIMATDLPLSDRQLKRILKRSTVGISRVGGHIGHGSGEIAIGFTTQNRISTNINDSIITQTQLNEQLMDIPFRAMIEATEEAIVHALLYSESVRGYQGNSRMGLTDLIGMYRLSL